MFGVCYVSGVINFKDYKNWMKKKAQIHNSGSFRRVNVGDVVWAAVGENVGAEIDGKSDKYSRPVVVLKKHGAKCFTGIPLTTKIHHVGKQYIHFVFQNREEVAVLSQAKLFDVSRVYSRKGELSRKDFAAIKKGFLEYFSE